MKQSRFALLVVFLCLLVLNPFLCGLAEQAQYQEIETPSVLDLLKERDPDLQIGMRDGRITWISGNLSDTKITDEDAALLLLEDFLPIFTESEDIEINFSWGLQDDSDYTYYTFRQYQNGISIHDAVIKMIADPEGNLIAISGDLSDTWDEDTEETVDEGTALQIVKQALTEQDPSSNYVFTEDMGIAYLEVPVEEIDDPEDGSISSKLCYIFYSNNPSFSNDRYDMPYIAHYVTVTGYYAGSMPCTQPGSSDAESASMASSLFEGKTASTWTGTVVYHDGSEHTITVPVMVDEDGVTYLGDLDRKILIMECIDTLNELPLEECLLTSERMTEWPNKVMIAYANYIKVWDFFASEGWIGPDGIGTPMVLLNNYCDEDGTPVDNAVYMGLQEGLHYFATSEVNDYCECVDVIGHEFTHAVTTSALVQTLYKNESGAMNEAMSDIIGNIIEMTLGETEDTEWLIAENSGEAIRSMSDPHAFTQPAYVGDRYWVPKVRTFNQNTDYGGVHTNSSLLNQVAYQLYQNGMSLDDLKKVFFSVICSMLPETGNSDIVSQLVFAAKVNGLEDKIPVIESTCKQLGFGIQSNMLIRVPDDCGRVTFTIPETDDVSLDDLLVVVTAIPDMSTLNIEDLTSKITGMLDLSSLAGLAGNDSLDLSSLDEPATDDSLAIGSIAEITGDSTDSTDLISLDELSGDVTDMLDLSSLGDLDVLEGELIQILAQQLTGDPIVSWPDGNTGRVCITLPAGNYAITVLMMDNDTPIGAANWAYDYWIDAASGDSDTITIESGCELWLSSDSLTEALLVPYESETEK